MSIISGDEEGVFGYLAVNYLASLISPTVKPVDTAIALDLGGASTQITFVPSVGHGSFNPFEVNITNVNLYKIFTYRLSIRLFFIFFRKLTNTLHTFQLFSFLLTASWVMVEQKHNWVC